MIQEITDETEWTNLISQFKPSNLYQTSRWANFYANSWPWSKVKVIRLADFEGKDIVAACQFFVLSRGLKQLFVMRGPLFKDGKYSEILKYILEYAIREKVALINIWPDAEPKYSLESCELLKDFEKVQEYRMILALENKSEEDLLKNMNRNRRRHLKRVDELGLKLTFSAGEKDVKKHCELYRQAAEVKKYVPYPYSINSKEMWANLKPEDYKILFADIAGKCMHTSLFFLSGDRVIHESVADFAEDRNLSADTFVIWELAKFGLKNGFKFLDLQGVRPEEQLGIYEFKKSFGTELYTIIRFQKKFPKNMLNINLKALADLDNIKKAIWAMEEKL